jgi:putative flippase GtrA
VNDLDAPTADGRRADRLGRNLRQFVKFCFVGGSGVVVNLAVFNLTMVVAGRFVSDHPSWVPYLANGLGFVVSVLTNYYLNRRWTFRSTGAVSRELPRFFTVSVIAYAGNLAVFALCYEALHLGENPSQLIAIACVLPVNFALNKIWSFRTP